MSGGQADIPITFRTVYGGVSMTLPANKVGDLLSVNGVVAVQEDALEQPLTDVTPAFLGADQVWPSLGGSTKAGQGVIVGVLDTGITPDHPSFVDHGLAPPPGGPFACQFGVGGDAPFSCNNKLVGAYAFLNTYTSFIGALPGENCIGSTCSARDADGHGTHTSSTAAGGPVDHATMSVSFWEAVIRIDRQLPPVFSLGHGDLSRREGGDYAYWEPMPPEFVVLRKQL